MTVPYQGQWEMRCEVCDDYAAYRGFSASLPSTAMKHLYCVDHGPRAKQDWVVTQLEELSAYTKWKTAQRRNHPSVNDDATGLFDA